MIIVIQELHYKKTLTALRILIASFHYQFKNYMECKGCCCICNIDQYAMTTGYWLNMYKCSVHLKFPFNKINGIEIRYYQYCCWLEFLRAQLNLTKQFVAPPACGMCQSPTSTLPLNKFLNHTNLPIKSWHFLTVLTCRYLVNHQF